MLYKIAENCDTRHCSCVDVLEIEVQCIEMAQNAFYVDITP